MAHFIDEYGLSDCTVLRLERNRLGYIAGHSDAIRRLKAGERQQRCARCLRYAWPDNRRRCEDFMPDGSVANTPADETAIEEFLKDE